MGIKVGILDKYNLNIKYLIGKLWLIGLPICFALDHRALPERPSYQVLLELSVFGLNMVDYTDNGCFIRVVV